MITGIQIVEHNAKAGVKIQAQKFTLRNVHLHQVLLTLSRLMNAILETDASNSGAGISAAESTAFQSDWTRVQKEWERGLSNRTLSPSGGHETDLMLLLVTQNQIMFIGNQRSQRALYALRTLAEVILSSDSAKQEFDIQDGDESKVAGHIAYVNQVMVDYIGVVNAEDSSFNRGLDVAPHTHLGQVIPPETLGEVTTLEPGPSDTAVILPDVPDTDSPVPIPGH